jgi:H+-transporting ATPase
VLGNQAALYALRERGHMWRSRPSGLVLASSVVDVGLVSLLASYGVLMQPLPLHLLSALLAAAVGFAVILDQIKMPIVAALKLDPKARSTATV